MTTISILYHLALFGVVLWLWRCFSRKISIDSLIRFSLLGLTAALLLGILFGDFNAKFHIPEEEAERFLFSNLRLFAQGIFVEGPLFLFGCGTILLCSKRDDSSRRSNAFLGGATIIFAFLAVAVGIDAFWIEPTDLQIRSLEIKSPKVKKRTRIVLATDIQLDVVGDYEKQVLETIKKQNADLILLGGDYIQYSRSSAEIENNILNVFNGKRGRTKNLGDEFNRLLRKTNLSAPLGVYAIPGTNKEAKLAVRYFQETGVRYIRYSQSQKISDDLRLTCLGTHNSWFLDVEDDDFPEESRRDFQVPDDGLKKSGKFHILIGHAPAFFMSKSAKKADLLLAGHTHGGQVRIPLFGPIFTMTPGLPRSWASGLTTVSSYYSDVPKEKRTIYRIVSNGTGMERGLAPRVRFFCRPDIWVVDLIPEIPAKIPEASPRTSSETSKTLSTSKGFSDKTPPSP